MTISVVCDPHYHGDRLFDETDPSRNRDDCLRPWIRLAERLRERGFEIHTDDLVDPKTADLRLYCEVPNERPPRQEGSFLVNLESPIVRRRATDPEFQDWFDGVFSWAPGSADPRYRQIRIPFSGAHSVAPRAEAEQGMLCLIAGNKDSRATGELYSERRRVIRWFERHRPEDFGLYGVGWDRGQPVLRGLSGRVLSRLGISWNRRFPSYRGPVDSKAEVLRRYRFCLAFENVEGFAGYVTEKILDPMLAGCIPVYRGAPDILEQVPADCFVDASKFRHPRDLADHLATMTDSQIAQYRRAMATFLEGPRFQLFSPDRFAESVVSMLLGEVFGDGGAP